MEHSFKTCPKWIFENINNHLYDLYLLADIDIPWKNDPQREHPHLRKYFFELYENELKIRKFPYEIVSGIDEVRLKNAIKIIDRRF